MPPCYYLCTGVVMSIFFPFCPHCYSQTTMFKSRYRGWERFLPLLLIRPVRCAECHRRHYTLVFYRATDRPAGTAKQAA